MDNTPISLINMLVEDSRMAMRKKSAGLTTVISAFLRLRGFKIICYYRISHKLYNRGHKILAGLFHRRIVAMGVDIHPAAKICPGLYIPHPHTIVIGSGVRLGCRVRVLHGVTLGGASGKQRQDGSSQPHVGDDVVLGTGAKIIGPVNIGNNVRIGANAVVTKDVPDNSIAVGIPAKVIKENKIKIALS